MDSYTNHDAAIVAARYWSLTPGQHAAVVDVMRPGGNNVLEIHTSDRPIHFADLSGEAVGIVAQFYKGEQL